MTTMATDTVMVTVMITATKCWKLGAPVGIQNSVMSLARFVYFIFFFTFLLEKLTQILSIHADCCSIMAINIKIRPSIHHTITIWG